MNRFIIRWANNFNILFISLFTAFSLSGQNAHVQVIHNSADHILDAIDIYADDSLLVDSISFREATAYLEVPANQDIIFAIQNPTLPDTTAALSRDTLNFTAGDSYVLIASGLVSSSPYDSLKELELAHHTTRRTANVPGNTDILLYHGVVDGNEITIDETTLPMPMAVDSLPYGQYSDYLEYAANSDYVFEVIDARTKFTIAEYEVPLQNMGLQDSSIVVVASGFQDTLKQEPGDPTPRIVPRFQLFAAMPSGGDLVALPIISDVGTAEFELGGIDIYPVPADKNLYIQTSRDSKLESAAIYSMTGKLVKEIPITGANSESQKVSIKDLKRGYYLVKLKTASGTAISRRILVE